MIVLEAAVLAILKILGLIMTGACLAVGFHIGGRFITKVETSLVTA